MRSWVFKSDGAQVLLAHICPLSFFDPKICFSFAFSLLRWICIFHIIINWPIVRNHPNPSANKINLFFFFISQNEKKICFSFFFLPSSFPESLARATKFKQTRPQNSEGVIKKRASLIIIVITIAPKSMRTLNNEARDTALKKCTSRVLKRSSDNKIFDFVRPC